MLNDSHILLNLPDDRVFNSYFFLLNNTTRCRYWLHYRTSKSRWQFELRKAKETESDSICLEKREEEGEVNRASIDRAALCRPVLGSKIRFIFIRTFLSGRRDSTQRLTALFTFNQPPVEVVNGARKRDEKILRLLLTEVSSFTIFVPLGMGIFPWGETRPLWLYYRVHFSRVETSAPRVLS